LKVIWAVPIIGVLLGIFLSLIGFVPSSFSSNDNLFITPEIAQSGILVGHQVAEVKIDDPDISDTDEAHGEPNITVNGKTLRMVQSSDGNWYGYFADRRSAQIADQTVVDAGTPGQGTDFGTFCSIFTGTEGTNISADSSQLVETDDSIGIALPNVGSGGIQGLGVQPDQPFSDCTDIGGGADNMNVIPTVRVMNPGDGGSVLPGQINLNPDAWPFIQLLPFENENVVSIQHTRGGIIQRIDLTFFEQTPTSQELIEGLIMEVQDKNLSSKVEMRLLQPLDKILKNLNDDNPKNDKNICKSLDVFINKVKSQAGKQISFNDAQDLIDSAEQTKQNICN